MPVFRVGRLPKWGELGAAISHNHRARPTPNADPRRTNEVLEGGGIEKAKALLKATGATVRDNSTLAAEAVFSASPEWFRPDGQKAGEWDGDRLAKWREKTLAFFGEKFGAENVVSAVLHLDEQTPHLHIIWLPLVANKEGRRIRKNTVNRGSHRLSYHEHLGGSKARLSQLQREYFEALQPLGFDPPRYGSAAEHQTIAQYYENVRKIEELKKGQPEIVLPHPADRPKLIGKEQWDKDYNENIGKVLDIGNSAVEASEKLRKEEAKNKQLESRIKALEKENKQMRYDLKKLRGLDLVFVLSEVLGAEEDKDSRPHHKTRLFILPTGEKVGVTDNLWYDNAAQKGGAGAIDLVSHFRKTNLKESAALLSSYCGAGIAAAEYGRAVAHQEMKSIQPSSIPLPERGRGDVSDRVIAYLYKRGVSKEVLGRHWGNLVYPDGRGNVVMKRENGGAFLRGSSGDFKQSLGGAGCGGALIPALRVGRQKTLAIVESPIDGLAYQSLFPESAVFVCGGNLLKPSKKMAERIAAGYDRVLLAQDADPAGDRMAAQWGAAFEEAAAACERHRPPTCKDWAEMAEARASAAAQRQQEAEASRRTQPAAPSPAPSPAGRAAGAAPRMIL